MSSSSSSSSSEISDQVLLSTYTKIASDSTAFIYMQERNDNIPACAAAIQKFINNNSSLCPLFSLKPSDLEGELKNNRFLVINGTALSLSDEIEKVNLKFRDFFTLSLAKNPVCCEKQHILELPLAKLWVQRKGDICPNGQDHKIGIVKVDTSTQNEVNKISSSSQNGTSLIALTAAQENWIRLKEKLAKKFDLKLLLSDGAKIFFKSTAKPVLKQLLQKAAYTTVKKGASCCGFLLGIFNAFLRCKRKQPIKAGIELASGVVSLVPGFGLVLSLGIDLTMAYHDATSSSEALYPNFTLADAYDILFPSSTTSHASSSSSSSTSDAPSKEQVDRAYDFQDNLLDQTKVFIQNGSFTNTVTLDEVEKVKKILKGLKNFIYQQRGWN